MMFTNFEIILVTFKDLLQFVMATKGERFQILLLIFCIIQKAPFYFAFTVSKYLFHLNFLDVFV